MKKIAIGLGGLLFVLIFIIPLFLPNEFNVERTIVIQSAPLAVFKKVSNFQTWSDWSPWYAEEPEAEVTFEGTPGVVGSLSRWKGKKIGSGTQTLTKVVQPEYLETELNFSEPNSSKAIGYWNFSPEGEGTKVVWGIKGDAEYPIGRYFGLVFDSMIGAQFEKGLLALKATVEKESD